MRAPDADAPERGLPQAGQAHLAVGPHQRLPQGAGPEQQGGILGGVPALQLLLQQRLQAVGCAPCEGG